MDYEKFIPVPLMSAATLSSYLGVTFIDTDFIWGLAFLIIGFIITIVLLIHLLWSYFKTMTRYQFISWELSLLFFTQLPGFLWGVICALFLLLFFFDLPQQEEVWLLFSAISILLYLLLTNNIVAVMADLETVLVCGAWESISVKREEVISYKQGFSIFYQISFLHDGRIKKRWVVGKKNNCADF